MSIFYFGKNNEAIRYFAPNGDRFKEIMDLRGGKSINDISIFLGYNTDQVHSYFSKSNNKIEFVVVEIFTNNIVFVAAKNVGSDLSKKVVDDFMRSFDMEFEYRGPVIIDLLEEGIRNKSLRIEFLARILSIKNPEPNGLFNIPSLGLNLGFSNGFLTDIISADGLNEWARNWKEINPKFIESYEKEAAHYWNGDISKVLKEINSQAEAYANTPEALLNEFVDLHISKFGNVNFVMLLSTHYAKRMSLSKFTEINFGRFKLVSQTPESNIYQLGNFAYEFSGDDMLLGSKLNK